MAAKRKRSPAPAKPAAVAAPAETPAAEAPAEPPAPAASPAAAPPPKPKGKGKGKEGKAPRPAAVQRRRIPDPLSKDRPWVRRVKAAAAAAATGGVAVPAPAVADRELACVVCAAAFVWAAGEQERHQKAGLTKPPTRCGPCLAHKLRKSKALLAAPRNHCANCKTPGHASTLCPKSCFNCLETGHTTIKCPKPKY